jgi:hypothetical protein
MRRFVLLLPIVAALAGCVTTQSGENLNSLAAKQSGIVILHTSMHDQKFAARCDVIEARLAQADSAGQYLMGQMVTLKGPFDMRPIPSRVELPAGEYGIVGLHCSGPRHRQNYHARVAKRGSIIDGSGRVYEQPIAKFKVGPGEVVDIGSLRLPTRRGGGGTTPLGGPIHSFVAVVTPIPEDWLKGLAEADPKLFEARVVRPMAASIRI